MIASGPAVLAVTASLPLDTEVYLLHVISWPQRVTPAVPLVTAPAPCTACCVITSDGYWTFLATNTGHWITDDDVATDTALASGTEVPSLLMEDNGLSSLPLIANKLSYFTFFFMQWFLTIVIICKSMTLLIQFTIHI